MNYIITKKDLKESSIRLEVFEFEFEQNCIYSREKIFFKDN